jgi:Polyketide cyclase / dehydrase and lipid transport
MRIHKLKNNSHIKEGQPQTLRENVMPFQSVHQSSASVFLSILSIAGVLTLAACAVIGSSAVANAGKENSTAVAKYQIAITRSMVIPRAPHVVFAFIASEDVLPKVLTGYGPLPAVVRTSQNTGPWDQPGSARIVHLADGNTARERVTFYSAPHRFAYRVWDVSHPIVGTLANEARGEWTFAPHPNGTLVTWTYTFSAVNALASVPLAVITKIFWRGYMDVCLDNAKRLLSRI